MKLVNTTRWTTAHLRAIAARVLVEEVEPRKRDGYTIQVKYNRMGGNQDGRAGTCSGNADYHSREITVMVPSDTIDRVDLAQVIAHEMAHTRGMRHAAMRGSPRYRRVGNWREIYAWADGFPLEAKATPPKPTKDERWLARKIHAQQKLAQWDRAVKRAQTHRKKWHTRYHRLVREYRPAAMAPEVALL